MKKLQWSSCLVIISFLYYCAYSNKNVIENILATMLIPTACVSLWFWYDPQRYSFIHKIDGILAKTTIGSFIIYTWMYKCSNILILYSYTCIVIFIATIFFISHSCSSKEWCSPEHFFYHQLMHFVCFLGSLYAFQKIR
jgi:hypothetical protein